jgi:undecaprenyl-diphosphatase
MMSPDVELFRWINQFAGHTPWLDAVMVACATWSPTIFALVLVGCWIRWRPEWQRAAARAALAALLSLGVGQLIGLAVLRPRPFTVMPATVLVPHAADSSFPSDHATLALAVTVMLMTVSRRLGWTLIAFSMLVLVSRVYLGVHFPTDVLGGAALGASGAWVMLRLARLPSVGRWIDAAFLLLRRLRLAAP